jgi:hypothetical protein
MNPTSLGNLIKSGLLAIGVSSTILGYVSSEVWVAIGGVVLALGAAVWQAVALKTEKLINTVGELPEVAKVIVHEPDLAQAIPSTKVVSVV